MPNANGNHIVKWVQNKNHCFLRNDYLVNGKALLLPKLKKINDLLVLFFNMFILFTLF